MAEMLYSIDNGVARITINRPEQRNALNSTVLLALRQAIEDAGQNVDARVVTLTGAGEKVFCAGADLKAAGSSESTDFGRSDYRRLLLAIQEAPKPTIALARGHVMAGGLGIFLACDLTLACDDIHFSTPEIHVGMFPMMVLALLYRHVGRKKATEMMFLGEQMPAASAVQYGMVNQIYPRSQFDARAEEFLRKIAAKSPAILRLGKEAIRKSKNLALPEALEVLESSLARLMESEDCREGIRAFLEKRKPQWKN